MAFEPMIKNWGLLFPNIGDDSFKIRDDVARDFSDFCHNGKLQTFIPEGECYIGGKIFDDPARPNGYNGLTEPVASIERAGIDLVGGKMFCVNTTSEKKYYFASGDINIRMKALLRDAKGICQLPHTRWFYNDTVFQDDSLI